MDKTKIEWCDSTWNPVTGCHHDCEYCYARRIAQRFGGYNLRGEITTKCYLPRAELTEPLTITQKNGKTVQAPYPFGFEPTLHRYRLDQPKKWHEPRNIFVCSMADLFGSWVPTNWLHEVINACERSPQHRYMFLTKNPSRYIEYGVPTAKNMWYGTTVTREADIDLLRHLPKWRNTFVSIEPLLEPLNLESLERYGFVSPDWIIIGAESGNRAGKVIPQKEWVDNICEKANLTGAAVFMKDSLIPIVGEENMRREFPWDKSIVKE